MLALEEVGEDGIERVVAVQNAVCSRDPITADELVDWRRQAGDMVWLVASTGGRDVGAGIGIHGWHSPAGVGRIQVFVLEDARSRGVGTGLLGRLGAWLAERGCGEATVPVEEDDAASLAWARRRGFVEVSRDSVLALDLATADVADGGDPDVEIVPWSERLELARAMYEVFVEASPDIPGQEDAALPPYERWLANDMQGAADRADATFVALVDGDVVGYGKLAIPAAGDVAWHDLIGVRRAWRGRGVAGALKREQIRWAKAHGYRWLKTYNEERNEPVRRLNARHGYVLEPGQITVRGSVA